ncbi:ribosome-releasing factor 2, mitochondrial [Hylaeus volcanicus]|uniref:ribosome-releasing factor 2, mitochondrial n=1 Tax=Hylaeus volcanicus TaxID=313075 RepID=UPI0023B8040F|nr:ribosome-releasing factor 2, mitochondrial [Hylaeus volcanicus]
MKQRLLLTTSWYKFHKRYAQTSSKIVKGKHEDHETAKIRNIGILAHIDAGKTTTTERMLFYSGVIRHMGEVHHGNTVTDYMQQERERGITITSAAATFEWKNHRINLIDTPGHIDFTMEVEQTLRVLDGAVVILDGSAGVEAQTLTVCRQADKYNIPRIIYVNKMDRLDANFDMSVQSIESKLNVEALPTQFPIKQKGILEGIVNVITMEKLIFDSKDMGMKYKRLKLSENEDKGLWEMALEKRRNLTDKLSNMDDNLANIIIEQESLDSITAQTLLNSLYRCTVNRKGVPVLLGSSYKNIGVQPLMDSILLYLPAPDQNKYMKYYDSFGKHLSARAFKVVHDNQKGAITFFRIYTGSIKKGTKVYNVQREISEQVGKLYVACADDYQDVSEISHGNIAAVTGLKYTTTGDLITSGATVSSRAKKTLEAQKEIDSKDVENFFALNSKILEPVFFCSIEAPSPSTQVALETALKQLEREDPSLKVIQDEEIGQTVLAGMGELHIEIIKERIRSEFKIDAELGSLQIAYKEAILNPAKDTFTSKFSIGKRNCTVTMTVSLIPNHQGSETLLLDKTPDCIANIDAINTNMMKAIKAGVESVLRNGPKLGYPIVDMAVKLHWLEYGPGTVPTIVTAAISQSIRKLMETSSSVLLEPIMLLEIEVEEEYSSAVMADLPKRRAEIQDIDTRRGNKVIRCLVPLAELLGYSTELRILSSGRATFSLEFDHYEKMDPTTEAEAVKRVTGFY